MEDLQRGSRDKLKCNGRKVKMQRTRWEATRKKAKVSRHRKASLGKHCTAGTAWRPILRNGAEHYFSHGNLYTAGMQVFLCGQKGTSAGIRLVGKLSPWFLFIIFLLSVILVLIPLHPTPAHAEPLQSLPLSSFSYPTASSSAELVCPIDWVGFQLIMKLTVLSLNQNNKLFLQTLSLDWTWHIPLNAFWTSPVLVWKACRQHSQTRILVDSHLKAGVKLEREKGRGECSQLVLISVRFQLRFVKR